MTDLTHYLKKHPRMIGVLFTMLLAISQAGTAAANGGSFAGP
ncbi:hypothetical protein QA600_00325 [Natronococcus sp. A-GB1]|nr:hypothetical protein [Natronococcus sp. A-GB1]MDG5757789.1 hypothetical protein [Natronococcus sp. A-GB1]